VLTQYEREDAVLESAPEYDEVVFWFEHDLYDQLILLHHLAWLRALGERRGATRFALVCGDTYLGPLDPEAFSPLFHERKLITAGQVRFGAKAWQAFGASDPEPLASVASEDSTPLPFLPGALRRHFEDYPSVRDGLARSERQVLLAVEAGNTTPRDVFSAFTRMEECVFMGDYPFWTIVRRLATAPQAPVAVNAGSWTNHLPDGVMGLTDIGREMLAGRVDHVAVNGIDRWMGGVHLTSDGLWKWDGQRLVR
jgi:hypothetical protein